MPDEAILVYYFFKCSVYYFFKCSCLKAIILDLVTFQIIFQKANRMPEYNLIVISITVVLKHLDCYIYFLNKYNLEIIVIDMLFVFDRCKILFPSLKIQSANTIESIKNILCLVKICTHHKKEFKKN